jgi:hypothetical protein
MQSSTISLRPGRNPHHITKDPCPDRSGAPTASGRRLLFSGDPAQLPPVGETVSESFGTKSRSHLDESVRQAADNPIIAAAPRSEPYSRDLGKSRARLG